MLSVSILAVGKLKENYFRDGVLEYSKRVSAFCKFNITEIAEDRICENPSQANIEQCITNEGKKILSKLPHSAYVIALCIEGKVISSEVFAQKLEQIAGSGKSHIVFIIGGSYGLSTSVKERADFKLSLSLMTFPHQLARVLLSEQIYRGLSINHNAKYHK